MKKFTKSLLTGLAFAGALSASAAAPYAYEIGDLVEDANGVEYAIAGANVIPNGNLTDGMTGWTVSNNGTLMTESDAWEWFANGGPGDTPYINRTLSAGGGAASMGSISYTTPINPGLYFFTMWYANQGDWTRVSLTASEAGDDNHQVINKSSIVKSEEWNQASAVALVTDATPNVNLACSWLGEGAKVADYGAYPLELSANGQATVAVVLAQKKADAIASLQASVGTGWGKATQESVDAAVAAINALPWDAAHVTLADYLGADQIIADILKTVEYTVVNLVFNANDNYMANVAGSFKCQEELGNNCYWQIVPADNDSYLLYNPIDEVYAYRNGQWTMSTQAAISASSYFRIENKEGDLYYLIMNDTGNYVAADDTNANTNVWGNKDQAKADASGLFKIVVTELPQIVPPAPTDNLLEGCISGQVGNWPAKWFCVNRTGETVENNGNLRNADGGTTGEAEMFMIRWDKGNGLDYYYTYKVNVPEDGVYEFSMLATEWNNWEPSQNLQQNGSQLPGNISYLRVSLTDEPGYKYSDTQSFVFETPMDNPGAQKNGPEGNPYNFQPMTCKFYATAGEHYLSITGGRAIYPIKDLSLVKVASELTAMPGEAEVYVDAVYQGADMVGGWNVMPMVEEAEYIFVPADSEEYQMYTTMPETLNITKNGTLWIYQIVDGVHGAYAMADVEIVKPTVRVMFEDENLVNDNGVVKFSDASIEVLFAALYGAQQYYRILPTAATVEEGDEVEFTELPMGESFTISESCTMECYAEANGVKGDIQTIIFDKIEAGVEAIDAANDAEYFNLNGIAVKGQMAPGVYVVRTNGQVRKVIVK